MTVMVQSVHGSKPLDRHGVLGHGSPATVVDTTLDHGTFQLTGA